MHVERLKYWFSWLVPVKVPCSEPRVSYHGEEWVPWSHYSDVVRANTLLILEKDVLRSRLECAEALVEAKQQSNTMLKAQLEAATAKFESACIVNHLQRQKQTSYERSVYAASMGGMILDNQEEIARIAQAAMKVITDADADTEKCGPALREP